MYNKQHRTFVMVKPDGVRRGLVANIMARFEILGFRLAGCKMVKPDRALMEKHYDEHKGKPFFKDLVTRMCEGPVLAMVWDGENVLKIARKILGATNPVEAATGTIRGDLAVTMHYNVCHASDSMDAVAREVSLWFKDEELSLQDYELWKEEEGRMPPRVVTPEVSGSTIDV